MTTENTEANQSPGWMLQMVVPTPGQPFAILTVLDIGSFSLLSAEWVQGLNINVSTLKGLTAKHGYPRMLICDESVEFRSNELREWVGPLKIILEFKDLSGGQNRDIRFNYFGDQKAHSTGKSGSFVRIEFRGMEQADFYLDLCGEIQKKHSIAPGNVYRTRARGSRRGSRSGPATPTDFLSELDIRKLAKAWVHHSRELLEPAFIRSFEGGIEVVADSGFACHSSPSVLAGIALNEVRKVEEAIARIRPVISRKTSNSSTAYSK